ncbi:uncharacterized protein L201_005496 [Kwoniella dendrophila CBS 6074]|uniref:J domain-containing protein n=1 Tax=Kwoniella dendrophila CBS 6074 TaxID=1295534 RepID=A0AAX4K1A2_9TREE
MDDSDPIYTFFPESINSSKPQTVLYEALGLAVEASSEEIRKAYRRLALKYHPDKHSHDSKQTEDQKEELNSKFQQIGFAYTILSDEKTKKIYDKSGKTSDKFQDISEGEGGWEGYFESLFKRVDRKILDEDKERYQNSEEEKQDIIKAFKSSKGSLPDILSYIPHSTYLDEDRIIKLIHELIQSKEEGEDGIESTFKWEKTSKDLKAKEKRKKSGEKQAKEAEKQAKELGLWNEFYGNGEKGKRMSDENEDGDEDNDNDNDNDKKKKGKKNNQRGGNNQQEEEGLGALILKRQRERENGLNALEEKYRKIAEEERANKKAKKSKSKSKGKGKKLEENVEMPEISDADFEALQAKMFPKKDTKSKSK